MAGQFTIDAVAWHTQTSGNPETRGQIQERFWSVCHFLQSESLTRRTLARSPEEIDDSFEFHTRDLTDEGNAVMLATYDRWLGTVDRGGDRTNVNAFRKALAKIRGTKR